jgi:ribosome biogenesis GTPase A
MNKAMNQMQSRFKDTDCIIEIHDARIPISGRNPRFNDIIALRPHEREIIEINSEGS